ADAQARQRAVVGVVLRALFARGPGRVALGSGPQPTTQEKNSLVLLLPYFLTAPFAFAAPFFPPASARAAMTRSDVMGNSMTRAPQALRTALPSAAAPGMT